ncbi:MAG: DUF4013 domain-containing protein [Nanoarchaeota archaeon]
MATIGEGIRFPWTSGGRYFYFLVLLIPVVGWVFYLGYLLRVLRSAINGEKKIPAWGLWGENFILGLKMFLVVLVWGGLLGLINAFLGFLPVIGVLAVSVLSIVAGLVIMALFMQLSERGELGRGFDISSAFRFTFKDFWNYLLEMIKAMVVFVIYGLPSVILGLIAVLVGIASAASVMPQVLNGNIMALFNSGIVTALVLYGLSVLVSLFLFPAMIMGSYKLYGDFYRKTKA